MKISTGVCLRFLLISSRPRCSLLLFSPDRLPPLLLCYCAATELGLNGDDSNMMILMQKKKENNKGRSLKQGSLKSKKRERPKQPSSSQKRKLKKLDEEKEKSVLLSKSLETLEKYKIQEDAYSLMWSSRNLGQVETGREKRRREVQFAKTGLVLQHSDRPLKRRASESDFCEIEPASSEIYSKNEKKASPD